MSEKDAGRICSFQQKKLTTKGTNFLESDYTQKLSQAFVQALTISKIEKNKLEISVIKQTNYTNIIVHFLFYLSCSLDTSNPI